MLYHFNRAIEFIAFRTTKRYNIIKIRSLKPNYYDKDTLLLHAVMQLVVDYVEIELASEPTTKVQWVLSKLPWFIRPHLRSSKVGLVNLEWLISQKDDPNWHEFYVKLKEVYLWWTQVYPNRKSAEDLSGFTEYFYNENKCCKEHSEKKEKDIFDNIRNIELQYSKEESEMLKAVIDYRQFLWT